jgi:hypothetical protein
VRTTFTGATANNANPKMLRVYIGTALVMTKSLTPNLAGAWEVQVVLIATAASAQRVHGDAAAAHEGSGATSVSSPVTR